jgi:hypothetical protein
MSGELSRKLKTVLDETCLLILGAQVLFGFQFEAVFQEMFTSVGLIGRVIHGTLCAHDGMPDSSFTRSPNRFSWSRRPRRPSLKDDEEAKKHAESIARHVSNIGHEKQRNVLAEREDGTEVHKAPVHKD